jgi:hypothetical protein
MELRHLRYLLAVAAQQCLFTSQPSLSRPLEGDAPTVDLVIGYSRANTSPVLKLFFARAEELLAPLAP